MVCNIEKQFGDGGSFVKSAGTDATVFSHGDDGVKVKLASGKFATLNPKNRAMIGTLAGGGSGDRPLMRTEAGMHEYDHIKLTGVGGSSTAVLEGDPTVAYGSVSLGIQF